ncbi:uncharacterized protein EV422DRAFT_579002 [Fimicolochytrium jonesii]|uniref:uncharacterized protein n=1 Tax=Fimicolochytrium jonesii TaxID=1396493 RepID=UPI0022FE1799|nr:uncharacterized protein EV422DRAFT_579002 [Fimicolochytrium jonesii]KAI8820252.1 hypothetical protein EV422DRAFT_579002 [Fimicolochytrium jonesii]
MSTARSNLDFVIIADSTSSMVEVQRSLKNTLFQVFNLATLTGSFNRIGLMWYTDYTLPAKYPVTSWSGWCTSFTEIQEFIGNGELYPGGDEPEACKTALWEVLQLVDVSRTTVVIWYGDAAPHHISNDDGHPNYSRELKRLNQDFDWVHLCQLAAARGCVVCPIINTQERAVIPFFALIATITGGQAHTIPVSSPAEEVTRDTIRILLRILGTECGHVEASRMGYGKPLPSLAAKDENSLQGYLPFVPVYSKKSNRYSNPRRTGKTATATVVVPAIQVRIEGAEAGGEATATAIAGMPFQSKIHGHGLSMKELRRRFAEEEGYTDIAFTVFENIVKDSAALVSLTYNNVFAAVWRKVIRRFHDPRRSKIAIQFTRMLQTLNTLQKQQVREWLEASYDALEEIQETIDRVPADKRYPALALQSVETFRPQELTAVTSSCDRESLSRVIKLLANVYVIKEEKANVRSIPLALSDGDLIPLLPHLMCKGLTFSSRSSAILAILAVLSRNAVLHGRARSYLDLVRGQWLDMEVAGNYSVGFIRLAIKAEKILTAEESEKVNIVRELQGLLMNKRTEVVVKVSSNLKGTRLPDWKSPCAKCGKQRSGTLLTAAGECAPCVLGYKPKTDGPEDGSHMYDCSRCLVRYAVIETADLKVVRPRCHYCRLDLPSPVIRCISCNVRYIDANGLLAKNGDGKCAPCAVGPRVDAITGPMENVETTIGRLYVESPSNRCTIHEALNLLATPPAYDIMQNSGGGVYSMRHVFRRVSCPTDANGHYRYQLTYRGRSIHNIEAVLDTIREWARKHTAELGMCMMCCEEMKKETMVTACGRSGCVVKCCAPCVTTWYGYLQRGHVLPPANMVCPFCKRSPSSRVLARHNREACELIRQRPANGYDPGWYYGWCTMCMRPRQWMEKRLGSMRGIALLVESRSRRPTVAIISHVAVDNTGAGDVEASLQRKRYTRTSTGVAEMRYLQLSTTTTDRMTKAMAEAMKVMMMRKMNIMMIIRTMLPLLLYPILEGNGLSSLTCGYLPMGATIYTEEVHKVANANPATKLSPSDIWQHDYTWSGHPTCAAVALKCLQLLKDENLISRAVVTGDKFRQILKEELEGLMVVKQIRGKGIMIGIDLMSDFATDVELKMLLERKVVLRASSNKHCLLMTPPVILTEEEMREVAKGLKDVLSSWATTAEALTSKPRQW